jgi:AcrR family transcriptional regulator
MEAMTTSPLRRTQEERSSATREKLLEATIECLIELGYNGTTTTEIVRRAGVSRGAQVHHFPTKAELVNGAVAHLAKKREHELRAEFGRIDPDGDRVSAAIDLLWAGYAGPLFVAVFELIAAARTDPELATVFGTLQLNVQSSIESFCRETFGSRALQRKTFRDALALTMNLMHGLALTRMAANRPGQRGRATAHNEETDRLVEAWKTLVRPLLERAANDDNDGPRAARDGRRDERPREPRERGRTHG